MMLAVPNPTALVPAASPDAQGSRNQYGKDAALKVPS